MKMRRLDNKIAIITGGASGMGAAMAGTVIVYAFIYLIISVSIFFSYPLCILKGQTKYGVLCKIFQSYMNSLRYEEELGSLCMYGTS